MLKGWRTWAIVFAVATAVLGVVVAVQAAMLRAAGWRGAWGTVPDWLAAVGGIATVGALVVAWLVYRHDVQGRRDDEGQRIVTERRRQAELISAWFVHYGSPRLSAEIRAGQRVEVAIPNEPRVVINVAEVGLINASQVVIYDLIVAAVCEPHDPLPVAYGPTDFRITERVEWDEERDRLARGKANVLPPGQWSTHLRLATASLVPTRLHLFFRDHRGIYWWRDASGHLIEQPPPPDEQDPRSRDHQIADALGMPTNGRVGILSVKPLADARAT